MKFEQAVQSIWNVLKYILGILVIVALMVTGAWWILKINKGEKKDGEITAKVNNPNAVADAQSATQIRSAIEGLLKKTGNI